MNENAVQDIVSGFFQGALATKRTRHESAARLLGEKSRNNRKKKNEQSSDVERHGSLFSVLASCRTVVTVRLVAAVAVPRRPTPNNEGVPGRILRA